MRVSLDKHFGSVNMLKTIPFDNISRRNAENPSFVSAGRDGMLCLWSGSGDCLSSQIAHRGAINCVSEVTSGSKSLYLSCGSDNLIRAWDAKRLKLEFEFSTQAVAKICWFHNTFITGSTSGGIRKYESPSFNAMCDPLSLPTGNNSNNEKTNTFVANIGNGSSDVDWVSQDVTSHSTVCTDMVSSNNLVVSASKSGQIIRFTAR